MPESIFGTKAGGIRIQGELTAEDGARFKLASEALRQLYLATMGRPPGNISHADVVAYLLRGRTATRAQLLSLKASKKGRSR